MSATLLEDLCVCPSLRPMNDATIARRFLLIVSVVLPLASTPAHLAILLADDGPSSRYIVSGHERETRPRSLVVALVPVQKSLLKSKK